MLGPWIKAKDRRLKVMGDRGRGPSKYPVCDVCTKKYEQILSDADDPEKFCSRGCETGRVQKIDKR